MRIVYSEIGITRIDREEKGSCFFSKLGRGERSGGFDADEEADSMKWKDRYEE